MKNMKKIASLLLALALVFSLGFTATAADDDPAQATTGSITVANPQADVTYTAYKIFDAQISGDGKTFNYSISSESPWFDAIANNNSGTCESKIEGLVLNKNADNTYSVKPDDTATNPFSAAAFADTLKKYLEANASSITKSYPLTEQDGTVKATELELGYYFVTSSTGALCNLTTTSPNVTIHDKNDVPFDKTVDKPNVQIGDTVNFTIKGKVPDTTGFSDYIYEISDTMSEGLTFKKDVTVKMGEDYLKENDDYTITYDVDGNANSFKVKINVKKLTTNLTDHNTGKPITVTYTATVNKNAAGKIEHNDAKLEYSNDPSDSSKTTSITDQEKVYSAKIVIDKYDAGNESQKLSGAKFVLYKEENGNKLFYKYTEATGIAPDKVEWVSKQDDATPMTTTEQGAANFDGLKNGIYYLLETEAPDNYNPLTEPVKVIINGNDADEKTLTVTQKIANGNGTLLPEAGGMGTYLFYILGGALVAAAAGLMIAKRHGNNESK